MALTKAQATLIAQAQLLEAGSEIQLDGKWGRYTNQVFGAAPTELQRKIRATLHREGYTPESLFAARQQAKQQGAAYLEAIPLVNQSKADVKSIISAVAQEAGIEPNALLLYAKIESNFNPAAVNGKSRGLFQMTPEAWIDVIKDVKNLPPYVDAVMNPVWNARAGAAYYKLNQRRLRRMGVDAARVSDPAIVYLAHQQGSAGAFELLQAIDGIVPKTNYVSATRMKSNPPQDGKGVTISKPDFARRWIDVVHGQMV